MAAISRPPAAIRLSANLTATGRGGMITPSAGCRDWYCQLPGTAFEVIPVGAKSALMIYSDGSPAELLRSAPPPDEGKTAALVAATRAGPAGAAGPGGTLGDEIYPAEGIVYAGSFPGIDVLCDRDVMTGRPSQLPGRLLAPGAGRRVTLHAMHSASDWLGYAVWQDGVLVRSLSLSPDGGITEDIGAPLPFEASFWAGEHPVASSRQFPGRPPYPLPFHPLELGEAALLALAGFAVEGRPADYLIDPWAVRLISYRATPASPVTSADLQAFARTHKRTSYTFGPDGSLIPKAD
jgi:uncharacterized protein DUF6928